MNKFLTLLSLLVVGLNQAQDQPKLVVGIVVDQMRMDYIYRYWDQFENDGFKRMIGEGHLCKNAHFNYIPTKTGPGHASIYTGTTPMNHGIISNTWFDKKTGEYVYCSDDFDVEGVGVEGETGQKSPVKMLAPTLGDAFRISNQFRGKNIGISIKDRGAILPAGHSATAAYWMDYETGRFVSSTYYMNELPNWVQEFNEAKHPDNLIKDGWNTLKPIEEYVNSTKDDTPYERVLNEGDRPVFPYDVRSAVEKEGYYPFAISPFGSTVLRMLAEETIKNEELGADEYLDLLAVSFSSTDMAGHAFGPQSIEVEDTYIRLDREIAALLKTLDTQVGAGEYTVFLTADHAAAQVHSYLRDHKIPANRFDADAFQKALDAHLSEEFGHNDLIRNYSNQEVFLDHALIEANELNAGDVAASIEAFALDYEGVLQVLDAKSIRFPWPDNDFARRAQLGWNQQRSGDMMIQYLPGWMQYGDQGTTHGSSYNYDTHVPMIFYGFGVQAGTTNEQVDITQIVPTISLITHTAFPNLSDTRPVVGAIAE